MSETEVQTAQEVELMQFSAFLEGVHPSRTESVQGLWQLEHGIRGGTSYRVCTPEIRLHCRSETCGGVRTFRAIGEGHYLRDRTTDVFLVYRCSDCQKNKKHFSLLIDKGAEQGIGSVYKYGESPSFGVPVPNKVLRLFGSDAETFKKGRQCENQGLGVGAFAYYRRVVENHKNDIFDAIIKVCQTVGADPVIVEELTAAKAEISFSKSMEQIKTALPQGLLINGQNPLLALHGALSIGIHVETDEECLAVAQSVRLVLTDLVDKISTLRQEDADLKAAVELLLAKRSNQGAPKVG